MKINVTESVIIRTLGMNTTREESDFKFSEFEELHGHSVIELKGIIDDLRTKKKLITGNHRPSSDLALTEAGWELFEKLERDEIEVEGAMKVTPSPMKPRPKPVKRTGGGRRSTAPKIMVTIGDEVMPLTNSLSTKKFAGVTEVTVSAELPEGKFYFNQAWFNKKGIKVTVCKEE